MDQTAPQRGAFMRPDYYAILHITQDADQDAVKRAYRERALEHHPDRNPGDTTAEERFRAVSEAYETLRDPRMREAYDSRRGGCRPGSTAHARVFRGEQARARTWMPRGTDMHLDLLLTRDEASRGLELELEIPLRRACHGCRGKGFVRREFPTICDACGGEGSVDYRHGHFRLRISCPHCEGCGYTIHIQCPECGGHGEFEMLRRVRVRIPPGVRHGDCLVVEGEGEPGGQHNIPGDMHLHLHVSPGHARPRADMVDDYWFHLLRGFMGR